MTFTYEFPINSGNWYNLDYFTKKELVDLIEYILDTPGINRADVIEAIMFFVEEREEED